MNLRCKPGDRAFITGVRMHPQISGAIVKVIRRVIPGEYINICDVTVRMRWDRTADWLVESAGTPLPYMSSRGGVPMTRLTMIRPIADRKLRPIRPLPPEQEDEVLKSLEGELA